MRHGDGGDGRTEAVPASAPGSGEPGTMLPPPAGSGQERVRAEVEALDRDIRGDRAERDAALGDLVRGGIPGARAAPRGDRPSAADRLREALEEARRAADEMDARGAALAAANRRLEARVAERTGALARALEASRASEARFRAVAETVPQLIWTSRAHGRWDYANARWCEYTGQSEPQAEGLGWLEAVHPEDRVRTLDAWEEATVRTGTLTVEHRLRRNDGTWRWFETVALPVPGGPETGEEAEWVGASTDVHARRLAEARLREANETLRREGERRGREAREAEARFRAYFEAAPEALLAVVVEADGARFLHEAPNPACEALTGLRAEDVHERPAAEFLPPEAAAALEERYRLLAEGAGPQVFEVAFPLRDAGGRGDGRPGLGPVRVTLVPAGDGPRPRRLLAFLRPVEASGGGGEVLVRFDPRWRRDR